METHHTHIKELHERLLSKKTIRGIKDSENEIHEFKQKLTSQLHTIIQLESFAASMHQSLCHHEWSYVSAYDDRYRYCTKCRIND